jgi:hypothetical protein
MQARFLTAFATGAVAAGLAAAEDATAQKSDCATAGRTLAKRGPTRV